jgi:two-component system, cell cycle sensor histidine kinase and response regulator CckA
MIESVGYSVTAKASGSEAVTCFKDAHNTENPFAGAILDLTVPGGHGGSEVAAEIRKIDRNVPIFVASGYAADPIIATPTEYGFTDSISKPFKKNELMEMLEKHREVKGL